MKRVLSALGLLALVAVALLLPSPSVAATGSVPVVSDCNSGWYVNHDEASLAPEQISAGFRFDGPGLVHHQTTPVALASVPEVGFESTDVTGAKPLFKMETTGPYSTVNVVADGKAWSSKIGATEQGGQNNPVTLATLGTLAPYTETTRVYSFGVGYGNDTGNAATVTSITFGTKYDLSCKPAETSSPTPTATPTTSPTASPTPTASQTSQPTGTPTMTTPTTPTATPTATPTTASPSVTGTPEASSSTSVGAGVPGGGSGADALPVTGPKVLVGLGIGLGLVALGGLLLGLAKRRSEDDQAAASA